jgi:hypothetical protein
MKKLFSLCLACISILFFVCPTYAGLNDGIVAYYPLDGNCYDASGNGHTGTMYSATPAPDRFGNQNSACYFNGLNNYIEAPSPGIPNNSSFTVSFWIQYEWQPHRIWIMYFGYHDQWQCSGGENNGLTTLINVSNEWGEGLGQGDTQMGFFCGDQNRFNISTLQGSWLHIVSVYDAQNSTLKSFLNGNLIDEDTSLSQKNIQEYPLFIGKPSTPYTSDSYFKGSIDEVRLYNRVLSEAEIQELYGGVKIPNLVVSPQLYDFGKLKVGSCSATPQQFTLSNTGTGNLNISAISVSNEANFTLALDGGTNPCYINNPTIAPGDFRTLTVKFCPKVKGNSFANIAITSNDPDTSTFVVPLSGTTLKNGLGWVVIIDGMDIESTALPWKDAWTQYLNVHINDDTKPTRATIEKEWRIDLFRWNGDLMFTKFYVEELYKRIKLLNSTNTPVVILSHSWGTVLSYIALTKHSDPAKSDYIHVDKLITLGSPLGANKSSIWYNTAKLQLTVSGVWSIKKPSNLKVWHNYFTDCDEIGGRILEKKIDNYRNRQEYDGFRACHSSYFEDLDRWNDILPGFCSK